MSNPNPNPTSTAVAKPTAPTELVASLSQYGDGGKIHLVAPATDRFTRPAPMMSPQVTRLLVDANPDAGEVFKMGGKMVGGNWTEFYTLSKTVLERLAMAAGVIWDPVHTKAILMDRDFLVYQAVGWVRMPDGSLTRIIGTKEIDLQLVEAESRLLQTRDLLKNVALAPTGKKWSALSRQEQGVILDQAKSIGYEDLSPEQRRQIDMAVRAEVIEYRKHRFARAETGAKNRAIRSLGLKSTYTAAELRLPMVVVRWGLNPQHEYAQAEMRALWDTQPAMPSNPMPQIADVNTELARLDRLAQIQGTPFAPLMADDEEDAPDLPATAAEEEPEKAVESPADQGPATPKTEANLGSHTADAPGAPPATSLQPLYELEGELGLKGKELAAARRKHLGTEDPTKAPPDRLSQYYEWLAQEVNRQMDMLASRQG